MANGQEVFIHFEDMEAGATVEGTGAVTPLLTIVSTTQKSKIVTTGKLNPAPPDVPVADFWKPLFQAPNPASGAAYYNNCLEDANLNRVDLRASDVGTATATGFGDTDGTHNYTITLNVAISSFKIRMFDFGDFNINNAANHKVVATAYNVSGEVIDEDILEFSSDTVQNPEPFYSESGDACTATFGQPGYYEFALSSSTEPIAKVTIVMDEVGRDPRVAFDSIRIYRSGEDGCTPGYWKNHTDAWPEPQPGDLVNTQFVNAYKYEFKKNGVGDLGVQTLLNALSFKGGSDTAGAASILIRTAVASLLNAESPAFIFALSPEQVRASVDAALFSGDRQQMLDLAKTLDGYNNANCAIDAHYTPPVD